MSSLAVVIGLCACTFGWALGSLVHATRRGHACAKWRIAAAARRAMRVGHPWFAVPATEADCVVVLYRSPSPLGVQYRVTVVDIVRGADVLAPHTTVDLQDALAAFCSLASHEEAHALATTAVPVS